MSDTRVRFAPSPTGFIHIGNLRTALYGFLIARKEKGTYILRIEDTDRSRFVPGALEKVLETLRWAGIEPDEGVVLDEKGTVVEKGEYGPYTQSARLAIYRKYVDILIEKGVAYPCFCTKERLEEVRQRQQAEKRSPRYDKHCLGIPKEEAARRIAQGEEHVIRMNIPEDKVITFTDEVYGTISAPGHSLDDQVLMKSDGFPTYHLAVVVDDHLMKITHVVRGEDWIPSAPKHVLLYEYFGWDMPKFVHLPNLLGDNKKKLSKRQGDVSVEDFIQKGYLPEAIVNFIAYLGWHPKEDKEVMSLSEIIEEFDVARVQKAGAVFNREKLDWLNSYYIKHLDDDVFRERVRPFLPAGWELNSPMIVSAKERARVLGEVKDIISLFFELPDYEPSLLCWKEMTAETALLNLKDMCAFFEALPGEEIDEKTCESAIFAHIETYNKKRGEVLWPLRVALSGQKNSPSPFIIAAGLGRKRTIERIRYAIEKLEANH